MPEQLQVGVMLPGEAGVIALAEASKANAPVLLALINFMSAIVEKMSEPQVEALGKLVESWASLLEKQLATQHVVQDWWNAQIAALAKKEG